MAQEVKRTPQLLGTVLISTGEYCGFLDEVKAKEKRIEELREQLQEAEEKLRKTEHRTADTVLPLTLCGAPVGILKFLTSSGMGHKNCRPAASVKERRFPTMGYTPLTENEKCLADQVGWSIRLIAEQDEEIAHLRKEHEQMTDFIHLTYVRAVEWQRYLNEQAPTKKED